MENLINNAWKFSEKQKTAIIEFSTKKQKGKTIYFVRDNGIGFDQSKANRLFTPFLRLHFESEFKGSGIGLATVQRIIHRHGGRIWTESKVGKGATFCFTLK